MHSLSLLRWCRKELSNLRDIPGTRISMHKITMEIRKVLPIKRTKFWSKCPNKVGNWEDKTDDKEEKSIFLNSTICYEKYWEFGSLQKQKTGLRNPKGPFQS